MRSLTFYLTLIGSAILAAGAPLMPRSPGRATVKNQCGYTVYLWSIDNGVIPSATPLAPGAIWSEEYRMSANNAGISIKLARNDAIYKNPPETIEQFEYTLWDGKISYDLSEVDGKPFEGEKLFLYPSAEDNDTCKHVWSSDAYHQPKDDWSTHTCVQGTDLTFALCA